MNPVDTYISAFLFRNMDASRYFKSQKSEAVNIICKMSSPNNISNILQVFQSFLNLCIDRNHISNHA
jgi:hypothetical protein